MNSADCGESPHRPPMRGPSRADRDRPPGRDPLSSIAKSTQLDGQLVADQDAHAIVLGQPLDPRGEVHRVADQRIGQPLCGAHVADAAGAGIEADADLDLARPGHLVLRRHLRVERARAARSSRARARAALRYWSGSSSGAFQKASTGVADIFVDRRLAGEQDVGHRRQEGDDEADDLLRPQLLRKCARSRGCRRTGPSSRAPRRRARAGRDRR